jgi:hypothetical protein
MRDAAGDDACLARARARKDEHRAADCFDGEALLLIERGQIQHRARSLICGDANASVQGKFILSHRFAQTEHGFFEMYLWGLLRSYL